MLFQVRQTDKTATKMRLVAALVLALAANVSGQHHSFGDTTLQPEFSEPQGGGNSPQLEEIDTGASNSVSALVEAFHKAAKDPKDKPSTNTAPAATVEPETKHTAPLAGATTPQQQSEVQSEPKQQQQPPQTQAQAPAQLQAQVQPQALTQSQTMPQAQQQVVQPQGGEAPMTKPSPEANKALLSGTTDTQEIVNKATKNTDMFKSQEQIQKENKKTMTMVPKIDYSPSPLTSLCCQVGRPCPSGYPLCKAGPQCCVKMPCAAGLPMCERPRVPGVSNTNGPCCSSAPCPLGSLKCLPVPVMEYEAHLTPVQPAGRAPTNIVLGGFPKNAMTAPVAEPVGSPGVYTEQSATITKGGAKLPEEEGEPEMNNGPEVSYMEPAYDRKQQPVGGSEDLTIALVEGTSSMMPQQGGGMGMQGGMQQGAMQQGGMQQGGGMGQGMQQGGGMQGMLSPGQQFSSGGGGQHSDNQLAALAADGVAIGGRDYTNYGNGAGGGNMNTPILDPLTGQVTGTGVSQIGGSPENINQLVNKQTPGFMSPGMERNREKDGIQDGMYYRTSNEDVTTMAGDPTGYPGSMTGLSSVPADADHMNAAIASPLPVIQRAVTVQNFAGVPHPYNQTVITPQPREITSNDQPRTSVSQIEESHEIREDNDDDDAGSDDGDVDALSMELGV